MDALPARAIESFAGVGNPFALRPLRPGEKVADVGCGAGPGVGTSGGTRGEEQARAFGVYGYTFLAFGEG